MGIFKSQKTIDWGLVIIINFLWATQVPVIRFIGDRLGPITVAFIPMVASTLIFLPVLWIENKRRNVKFRWKWNEIKYFLLSGLIGIFIMQYAYTLGSKLTIAANAGIITLTIPVFVAILASFMLKEKLNIIRISSFVLAIAGVLMTSISEQKIGILNRQGWAAFHLNGTLMIKCFEFDSSVRYEDFGCNNEVYVNGNFLEIETLGPVTRLTPGSSVEHTEHWLIVSAKDQLQPENEKSIDNLVLPLIQSIKY